MQSKTMNIVLACIVMLCGLELNASWYEKAQKLSKDNPTGFAFGVGFLASVAVGATYYRFFSEQNGLRKAGRHTRGKGGVSDSETAESAVVDNEAEQLQEDSIAVNRIVRNGLKAPLSPTTGTRLIRLVSSRYHQAAQDRDHARRQWDHYQSQYSRMVEERSELDHESSGNILSSLVQRKESKLRGSASTSSSSRPSIFARWRGSTSSNGRSSVSAHDTLTGSLGGHRGSTLSTDSTHKTATALSLAASVAAASASAAAGAGRRAGARAAA